MKFCTAINCMDGRTQTPVIEYLQKEFNAEYVDMITQPGPTLILSKQEPNYAIDSIKKQLEVSIIHHQTVGLGIVAHHGCAGNPNPKELQTEHLQDSIQFVSNHYPKLKIVGLWVDENFKVHSIT